MVSPGGYFTDLGKQFLQVARKLNPEHAQKPDYSDLNDLETVNVYGVSVFQLTPQLDRRLSCSCWRQRWLKCVHTPT